MTTFTIADDMPDTALARAIAKVLRADSALAIDGAMSARLTADAQEWISALARARVPVAVNLSGEIGPRGVALALLADAATLSESSAPAPISEGTHRAPMLAVLAAQRVGQLAARVFLAETNPLHALEYAGVLHGGGSTVVAAHKAALVAAAELPFEEAVSFAALLHANEDQP